MHWHFLVLFFLGCKKEWKCLPPFDDHGSLSLNTGTLNGKGSGQGSPSFQNIKVPTGLSTPFTEALCWSSNGVDPRLSPPHCPWRQLSESSPTLFIFFDLGCVQRLVGQLKGVFPSPCLADPSLRVLCQMHATYWCHCNTHSALG